jgi:hypothetical protein
VIIPWVYFLKEDQQLLIETFTGRWTVNGPGRVLARPFWRVTRRQGETLGPTDYLHIRDTLTGEMKKIRGPRLYCPTATEEILRRLNAIPLKKNEYLTLIDQQTGQVREERGEQSIYLKPTEEILQEVREAIYLKRNQYLRLIDKQTGQVRIERGEQSVYLQPTDKILEDVTEGVNIDEHTAVMVRDTDTGQLDLITEPQVFIPASNQEVADVRRRIVLEDQEAVVVKDRTGRYIIKRGTDEERTFFLDPYSKLVTFYWSTGIHKDQRNLKITKLDLRPKFMWYEFEARTQDNVEIVIGITFFWEVVDLEAMIRVTDDAPGDICSHARSAIIQAVSQVTLETFLAAFNIIIHGAVLDTDAPFYDERGVRLNAVEVRSIACKDAETQRVLHEIIMETTNRLKRRQKQESDNEVKVKGMEGQIEAEEVRGQLLKLRREHARIEALSQGEAEAAWVRAFFEGIGDDLPAAEKMAIFNTLRKHDSLTQLSQGRAQLYFTPADVDLSIESKNQS